MRAAKAENNVSGWAASILSSIANLDVDRSHGGAEGLRSLKESLDRSRALLGSPVQLEGHLHLPGIVGLIGDNSERIRVQTG